MLSPVKHRNPYLFPVIAIALGLSLIVVYGQAWYEMPKYSEKEIDASIEANLIIDIARMGRENAPTDAEMDRMRKNVREEMVAHIAAQRKEVEQPLGIGLIFLVFGFGQFLFRYLIRRNAAQDSTGGKA